MVAPVPSGAPDYDRGEWAHWTDQDGGCQDTRQMVLTAESLTAVTYRTDRRCRVKTGQWYGAFTGQTITSPSDPDVVHWSRWTTPTAPADGPGADSANASTPTT